MNKTTENKVIDGEKMRHIAKLLLVTNVISIVAFVVVFAFAASNKHQVEQCNAKLEAISGR